MPAVRKPKPSGVANIILKRGSRRVLMRCPGDYKATLSAACSKFELPRAHDIALHMDMSYIDPGSDEGMVELSADSWEIISDCTKTPVLEVCEAECSSTREKPILIDRKSAEDESCIPLRIISSGSTTWVGVQRSTTMRYILHHYLVMTDKNPARWKLEHNGVPLDPESADTVWGLHLDSGNDELYCSHQLVGGKPVIYLLSPDPISATVQLSLAPEWSFSAIYPVAPPSTNKQGLAAVSWNVDIRSDGTLLDRRTKLEAAYLYWEATTTGMSCPLSPPPEHSEPGLEAFIPGRTSITPSNSVCLDIADVPAYLDAALKAMLLHTEARTSFITYWLPALVRHKYVALRFLPQAAYEPAAPLSVEPIPDVITRVFMLFQGIVPQDRTLPWISSQPADWAAVVGVDMVRASDPKLFRVLEWGGMEIASDFE